jgi:NADPH-dependent curcumin reductase CurA
LVTRRNHQIVLARRPTGAVSEACFESTVRDVPELGEGEALLQVRYLGIDPTIRGWLDERGNYMPGVAIGEVVRSNGVGVVVETNNPEEYPLGRVFMHLTGWQEYCVVESNPFPPITMLPEGVALTDVLGVLGHIGVTAYVGVLGSPAPNRARRSSSRLPRAAWARSPARSRRCREPACSASRAPRPSASGWSTSSASTPASTTRPKTSRPA